MTPFTLALLLQPEEPQVEIVELNAGSGEALEEGDVGRFHLVLRSGEEVVVDTRSRGLPFAFEVGSPEIPEGFSIAATGMRVGGRRSATVPPELGFGSEGNAPFVAPDVALDLELELLSELD